MAKKETKGQASGTKRRGGESRALKRAPSANRERSKGSGERRSGQRQQNKSAADALLGLLESPLVADILAAGAAAALAAIAQRGFSRSQDRSSKAALKNAAKAAAAAMGARIAEEVDEIMRSSKESRREEA
jgi:hypothetical protein